jgi:hypothetical protein
MSPILKGSFKSVTMWAAFVLAVLSQATPLLTPEALHALGLQGPSVARLGLFFALVMGACRFITTTSLTDKGT